MKKTDKITIIIPVYNEMPWLIRCLSSVARQSIIPEVIIIDDGSTDGSGTVCDQYADKYGFRVYHIENSGVSHARNYGLDHTETEFVTFLDSDDEMADEGVRVLLEASKLDENIVMLNHWRQYSDRPAFPKMNLEGVYGLHNRPSQWWGVWNKLYKTSFIRDNNVRFWEDMHFGEDEMFNLELLIVNETFLQIGGAALIRHFNNRNSLVHTMSAPEVIRQDNALHELIADLQEKGEDQRKIEAVHEIIAEHRASKLYEKHLNGLKCF